jgi:hypothetical protein
VGGVVEEVEGVERLRRVAVVDVDADAKAEAGVTDTKQIG